MNVIDRLDGADVLYISDKSDFGCMQDWDGSSVLYINECYLAICKYDDDFSYYLLFLNENMEVVQDTIFDTVEEALECGKQRNSDIVWNKSDYKPRSTRELIALLSNNTDMHIFKVACCGLSEKADKESILALREYLKNRDSDRRQFALVSISKHLLWHLASKEIMASINDESPYVIRTTLGIIGWKEMKEAYPAVHQLTKSDNQDIRRAALEAIPRII